MKCRTRIFLVLCAAAFFILIFLLSLCTFEGSPLCASRPERDRNKTLEIVLKNLNLPYDRNESLGAYLAEDWTADMSAMRLFNPEPPRPCDENTDFLVTVISNSNETKQREDVRRTWASEANRNTTTKVVFIVARPKAGNYGREFWAEADKYDDIVMANFRDDYHNLSMKSYSALKYHLNYCPQARCLLKIDTDVVANLRGLENLCRRNGDSPLITGNGWTTGGWGDLVRNDSSKHYVPKFVYNATYPPYVSGPGYLLSGCSISALLLKALRSTPFHTSENFRRLAEDVVVTGIARSIAEVPLAINGGFEHFDPRFRYWCPSEGRPTPLLLHHAEPLEEYWAKMKAKMAEADSDYVWLKACVFGFS